MNDNDTLTTAEAARELGISQVAVRYRLEKGLMQGQCIVGKVWLIPRSEVEAWRGKGKLSPGPKRKQPQGGAEGTS